MSDLTIDPTRTALVRIEFGERIHLYGILKGVADGNAFVKGTWGAAIVDAFEVRLPDVLHAAERR